MSLKSDPFIPLVDLSPFTHEGAPETRVKASRDFCNACRNFGFANVIGHGVSESMLQEAFSWSKKLFDLPHEEKMKAPHPASSMPHRGYSPPGLEKVYSRDDLEEYESKGQQAPSLRKIQDFKESYEIGSEHNPPQPNIWLPEEVLPGYREFTTTFYWELDKAAKIILEAIALGLNLTKDEKKEFLQLHSGHNNQLRLLHYPSIEAEKLRQQVVGRMPPHQDWSSFTFLFQDDVGGLELLDPHSPNSFIAAQPIPGACILNVGDMLQRFTNGTFPSAMHRVTLPPLDSTSQAKSSPTITRARYSIPYFVAPDNDSLVECLSSCITADQPKKYEPVKFSEYGEWLSKHMYKDDGARQTNGA